MSSTFNVVSVIGVEVGSLEVDCQEIMGYGESIEEWHWATPGDDS